MGYKMNSKKRRIAIKGCCAFIASASPLTLAMYRADTVYGEVDFRQGFTVITAASLIIAMFQIAVSMWYEKNSSRCDKTASASLRIKTAYAILEWAGARISPASDGGCITYNMPRRTDTIQRAVDSGGSRAASERRSNMDIKQKKTRN